jgi:superfamily II DNA or RNA helicase
MKYTLRHDQTEFVGKIYEAWNGGAQNVVGVASTGFGKTVCLGFLVEQHPGASCVIAHRQELVGQISMTLAAYGIRHNIIAAEATTRAIAAMHVAEYGACYYTPSARCAVASVDTLVRRDNLDAWAAQVTLWISDEGHHVVRGNKWSNAIGKFTHPACHGLLPTATPDRADGKGLGRHADGLADAMVQAPPMRWLIEQGFLTDYRIVCVESDLQLLDSEVAAGGDWSTAALRKASEKSHIVGDVVANYLRFAAGTLGVTFATDVETAQEMTAAYRAAGVAAECLTGKTQDMLRRQMLKRFAARQITQIVAVDIISEGFDLPAIETISMARPTQSLALYMQQFGRGLRPLPGKVRALILDHAGNVVRHGLPDRPRAWTLNRRDKRGKSAAGDAIPVRVCLQCYEPFERKYRDCPHCGFYHEPASRGSPAMVDGDLAEMSPELLEKLRQGVQEATHSVDDERWRLQATGLPAIPIMGLVNRHAERLDVLAALRDAMAVWGGRWHAAGENDSMIQRRFFHTFGVDVMSAQALKRAEAQALLDRLVNSA